MSKPVQIFLCHASEDKPKVVEVYRFLQQQGFKPWLDKEDLLPGQRWDQEIPKALKASDFVLIFFSQKSTTKRGYVQKEFKLALEVLDEIPEGQIFVIPVRLDDCEIPERFHLLQYCDLFNAGGPNKIVLAIRAGLQGSSRAQPIVAIPPHSLRSEPMENLSDSVVRVMLDRRGFFDEHRNKQGQGPQHQYEVIRWNREKLVIDLLTDLVWQQSGSEDYMHLENAQKYVENLNRKRLAGRDDWRLPTIEEAMSLVESKENVDGLHIDPVFDKAQSSIWTADKASVGVAWLVSFTYGHCHYSNMDISLYVRAVRSRKS